MKERDCEQLGSIIYVVDGVRADGTHVVKTQSTQQNGEGEPSTTLELFEAASPFATSVRAIRVEDEQVTQAFGFVDNLSASDMEAARETLEKAFRSCTHFYNFGLPKEHMQKGR